MIEFVNRKIELNSLRDLLSQNGFKLIIIKGRRRVGKTELINHVLKEFSAADYFKYTAFPEADNLEEIRISIEEKFPDLKGIIANDLRSIFYNLTHKVKIIVIDEFPYFLPKSNSGINRTLGLLNSLIENSLNQLNLKLILCGSSIMMMNKIQNNQSPIYLRQASTLNLKAMNFYHLFHFFPNLNLEEIIEIYSFAGGVPYYLDLIKSSQKEFWDWFNEGIARKSFLLYPDPENSEISNIFRLSFPISSRPLKIVKAIAVGNHTKGRICSATSFDSKTIMPYIQALLSIGIINEEISIEERELLMDNRKERNIKRRYIINDNYIQFFYNFLYQNREEINFGIFKSENIKKSPSYSQYLGKIFEEIVLQFCVLFRNEMPVRFAHIGRFWIDNKKLQLRDSRNQAAKSKNAGLVAQEIDLVAFNDDSQDKNYLFIECKWKNKINSQEIAKNMYNKLGYLKFKRIRKKTPIFLIFGRNFNKKINHFKSVPVYCYDLEYMENKLHKARKLNHF